LDGVSVVRRKFFSKDDDADLEQIRKVVASRRKLGAESVFAELNVGVALDVLREFNENVDIVADPLPAEGEKLANRAHALIKDLPFDGQAVGSLTSELAGDLLVTKIVAIHRAVLPKS
jgi:hypothetical protein